MDVNKYNYFLKYHKYYYWWRKQYILLVLMVQEINDSKSKMPTKRRIWVRDIFSKRKEQGAFHNLVQEMRLNDPSKHFNYLRMSANQFDELLRKIGPLIAKDDYVRESISPSERLALTLRYLASGDSMISISYAFRVGKTSVSNIINETCEAIWNILRPDILKVPTSQEWKDISKGFENLWHLPNCLGSIDGKHVVIQAPPHSGSDFYNYKHSHSIVLMAVCDHRYRFTLVDIGARGRQSDGGILRNSTLGKLLLTNQLNFPEDRTIEYAGESIPYYMVGDEAFPLLTNLMRPYPGRFLPQAKRIFNYRLCRARRVIENAFGVLAGRWRIFRRPINTSLKTCENIIKASVCLHNWLMTNRTDEHENYCPLNYIDREDGNGNIINGQWREESNRSNLLVINRTGSNNSKRNAAVIRDNLTSYFMFDGAVSFQWSK